MRSDMCYLVRLLHEAGVTIPDWAQKGPLLGVSSQMVEQIVELIENFITIIFRTCQPH